MQLNVYLKIDIDDRYMLTSDTVTLLQYISKLKPNYICRKDAISKIPVRLIDAVTGQYLESIKLLMHSGQAIYLNDLIKTNNLKIIKMFEPYILGICSTIEADKLKLRTVKWLASKYMIEFPLDCFSNRIIKWVIKNYVCTAEMISRIKPFKLYKLALKVKNIQIDTVDISDHIRNNEVKLADNKRRMHKITFARSSVASINMDMINWIKKYNLL